MAVRDPGVEHPGLPVPARPGRLPHVGRGGGEGGVGVAAALGRGVAGLGGEQVGLGDAVEVVLPGAGVAAVELSTNLRKVSQCSIRHTQQVEGSNVR